MRRRVLVFVHWLLGILDLFDFCLRGWLKKEEMKTFDQNLKQALLDTATEVETLLEAACVICCEDSEFRIQKNVGF